MSGISDLGVVETIYEEEDEEQENEEEMKLSNSSCVSGSSEESTSFAYSPRTYQPFCLHSRVEEWARATGFKTDVIMIVEDQRFYLHKEPLTSRSVLLRRLLTGSPSPTPVTLPPQYNISATTFGTVADYCYGGEETVTLTPFNVAALWVAADRLEMVELAERTERYFGEVVAAGPEFTAAVLRSCLQGFLEADDEKAAVLAGRCVEALAGAGDEEGVCGLKRVNRLWSSGFSWLEDVAALEPRDFRAIVSTIKPRLADRHRNQDVMYDIIGYYMENHVEYANAEAVRESQEIEKQKEEICSLVDCRKLSRRRLVELVRNPRMPLRFVVQAMMAERLRTSRALVSHMTSTVRRIPSTEDNNLADATAGFKCPLKVQENLHQTYTGTCASLGTFLQHDAALRQAAQLREVIAATGLRIQALEEELAAMRKQLKGDAATTAHPATASRSGSLRAPVDGVGRDETRVADGPQKPSGAARRSLGRILMQGIRNAFRTSTSPKAVVSCERSRSSSIGWAAVDERAKDSDDDDEEDDCSARTAAIAAAAAVRDEMRQFGHRRSRSFA